MTSPRQAWRVGELASAYGVAASTIRDAIRRGDLRAYNVGRALVVRDSDWCAYLSRNRVGGGR